MLARLSELGPEQVVITGASLASGERMANLGYDRGRSAFWYVACDYVPVSYPGTGDLFAAVLTGALLQDDSLPMAINRATASASWRSRRPSVTAAIHATASCWNAPSGR